MGNTERREGEDTCQNETMGANAVGITLGRGDHSLRQKGWLCGTGGQITLTSA